MTISKKGFWRIIALCSYLFCIASFFAALYVMQKQNIDIQKYLVILFPSLLSITLIYQLLFPLKLYSYAIWNYLFAIITLASNRVALSVIILFCSFYIADKTGLLKKYRKLFVCIGFILYLGLFFSFIRFGMTFFITALIDLLSTLITLAIIYFIKKYIFNEQSTLATKSFNEIAEERKLSERDIILLQNVLEGKKYETIASEMEISISFVKKRLSVLYKKFDVTNQIDFIRKYGGKI